MVNTEIADGDLWQHLYEDFVGLTFVQRSIEKTHHIHNENVEDDLGTCYEYGSLEIYEILKIAIEDDWPEKIRSQESIDKAIEKLRVRADFFSAYDMDVNRSTGILEKLYSYWENLEASEIQQPHQVVRIMSDIRRKAIESSLSEDSDNTLDFVEEDVPIAAGSESVLSEDDEG